MLKKFEGKWIPYEAKDDNPFSNICENICENEDLFSTFKTNPVFCQIIGNDIRGNQISEECLKKIKNQFILDNIEKYKKNDLYGGAPLNKLPIVGEISSGTIYFLLILDKIIENFGDINNFNVCEIGSGYGGQANILLMHGVKTYTCIDNQSTLKLAEKYLNKFTHGNVVYYDTDNIEVDREYDLVISNWCLSEFDNNGIKFYIDNIVSKSKYGYFEMNMWDKERKDFLLNEIKKHFPEVYVLDEDVKTHQNNNFLLICKR
jgi:hypothetical protein